MSITTVGNQLIHYEVLGRGQPLIFVHGWLGSWRYWWPSMQALSARHRSFAFDLWGFGDSSKAPDKYSITDYANMIENFIDQLGIARPITLVGHSLGAVVCLKYAAQYPDSVSKLVTVALPTEREAVDVRLANLDPDAYINRALGKTNSFPEIDSEIRKTDQQAMNQLAQEILGYDIYTDLTACDRPIMMVTGEQDTVITPPTGDLRRLKRAGNNRYFVSLQCHHFPMLQEKAKFNRLLMDFIHSDDSLEEIEVKEYWQRRIR